MDKISILIVEDNPADILLIKEYLAERDGFPYETMEADTLERALGLLAHYDFDVVLLDLSLPDSAGLETVRRVIAKSPEIAVIVLTGLQDEDIALQCVRYGAQDYLEKQLLSPVMLYKSVLYSIERKQALQQKEELLGDLALALEKIQSLEGILPICVSCKKIFAGGQEWLRIEEYVANRPGGGSSHVLCPSCNKVMEGEAHS